MKKKFADDFCALRCQRPERENCNMLASQAEHHVGINQFAFVADFFVFVQSRKRRAIGFTAACKGDRAFFVRDAALPFQTRPTLLAKCRHHLAQFRVHPAAVIALVVVFQNYFPVGMHLINHALGNPQIAQRVALHSFHRVAQLRGQRSIRLTGGLRRQIQKYKSAPQLHPNRVQRKLILTKNFTFLQMRRALQPSIQRIRPGMIRAANSIYAQRPPTHLHIRAFAFAGIGN